MTQRPLYVDIPGRGHEARQRRDRRLVLVAASGAGSAFGRPRGGTQGTTEKFPQARGPAVASASPKTVADRPAESKTSLTTKSMPSILREHHAACDDEVMAQEPVGKMREAYDAFRLTCPEAFRR